MRSKELPAGSSFSFHVFLGPIPADASSEEWFNSTARIGGHGISSAAGAGAGAGAGASVNGVIPLTRSLLERVGSLEAEEVLPYLKRELRWVIETVGTPFSFSFSLNRPWWEAGPWLIKSSRIMVLLWIWICCPCSG